MTRTSPTRPAGPSRWTLSIPALLVAGAFALALGPMANNDLWWHLETGRWMVEQGRLPVEDPFSFTGFMRPWHDVEWGAELALYGVWAAAGPAGLVLAAAVALALVFLLVRSLARLTTGSDVLASGLLVSGVVHSRYWWSPRPTLASDVCALLILLLLERHRRGLADRSIWLVPPIAALWANLHGGFVLAPVLAATSAGAALIEPALPSFAREGLDPGRVRRLVAVALLTTAAVFLNANGPAVLLQSIQMFSAASYRHLVDEWTQPPLRFVATAWCVVLAILLGARTRLRLSTTVLGLGLTALATSAHRFELYYGLLVLPILGEYLAGRSALANALLLSAGPLALVPAVPDILPPLLAVSSFAADRVFMAAGGLPGIPLPSGRLSSRLSWTFSFRQSVATAALAGCLILGLARERVRIDVGRYPAEAIRVLEVNGAKRVFHLYSWGGWLLWTSNLQTFIDGRSWGSGLFEEYVAALGPGYPDVFHRYDVGWTLLPPGEPLNRLLASDPGWERVHADATAVVFRRRGSGWRRPRIRLLPPGTRMRVPAAAARIRVPEPSSSPAVSEFRLRRPGSE